MITNAENFEEFTKQTEKLHSSQLQKLSTPFFMFLAGQDKIISNKAAQKFYQETSVVDRNLLIIEEANHEYIYEKDNVEMMTKDLVGLFNTYVS